MKDEDDKEQLSEFDIIHNFFTPLSEGYEGAHSLIDDCAYYSHNVQKECVINMDTLVADVHFFSNDPPSSIAYKALAVNLSDLAAKAAKPVGYLLSLSFPKSFSSSWLASFAEGLKSVQNKFNCHLMGGDTVSTSGPLTISVTFLGERETSRRLLRSNAKVGDLLYVTGTIGDAYLGLEIRKNRAHYNLLSSSERDFLIDRYLHPLPRLEAHSILVKYVNASLDISDGLSLDVQKLCSASECGAVLWCDAIPFSGAVRTLLNTYPNKLSDLMSGGDDYELLMSIDAQNADEFEKHALTDGVQVTQIGKLNSSGQVKFTNKFGKEIPGIKLEGYDHFE